MKRAYLAQDGAPAGCRRILAELDVKLLIRTASPGRDRLMVEIGSFGAL
jgi:hypothetical protein